MNNEVEHRTQAGWFVCENTNGRVVRCHRITRYRGPLCCGFRCRTRANTVARATLVRVYGA